ncbi:MAG TPA: alpha/beta fold hydrolase [Bacteroidales bacterium]|nr:alpha/beta fold hydrolase [Bacteroidales bacterium]
MEFNRISIPKIIVIVALVSFTASCTRDNDEPVNLYLVSDELIYTYSVNSINSMIDMASFQDQSVISLKQYVESDVKVFRIVYKTTIDGKDVNASGLVSVPVNKGEYPVLSFQNGTNTLNNQAPSIYPLNNAYVLVEIIASMGFVVVIPDYPGFGESVSIPHPYLVKEPTVTSITDMFYATEELDDSELPDINTINDYYLIGYSQGGWATLALHKALELEYNNDFNLAGSVCGAGPYDIGLLFSSMVGVSTYPMPVYIGYIFNAYSAYNQITNPASDIFNEPFASRISTLYNGTKSFEQINSQLSTSIPELLTSSFISGYKISDNYSSVRNAFRLNSIEAWHSYKPLLFIHGGSDTQVNPITTENIYSEMIQAGTSSDIIRKVIIPGADHSDGVLPAMIEGIEFLYDLKESR